jgi:hypothetical protein
LCCLIPKLNGGVLPYPKPQVCADPALQIFGGFYQLLTIIIKAKSPIIKATSPGNIIGDRFTFNLSFFAQIFFFFSLLIYYFFSVTLTP